MKITELSVYKSRKIQIEQYEPYDFGFGAKATFDEREDPIKAYEELEKWVDEKLEIETLKWKNPQKLLRNKDNLAPNVKPF